MTGYIRGVLWTLVACVVVLVIYATYILAACAIIYFIIRGLIG